MSKKWCTIAALAMTLAATGRPLPAQLTVILAGQILDPSSGTVARDQTVVVTGREITAVGSDLDVPQGAEIVDLREATVMPGLFDCHTHLCANGRIQGSSLNEIVQSFMSYSLSTPTPYRALQGVANARSMLEAGFTTVRDLGNAGSYADLALSRAIDEGLVPGPSMYAAGRIIAPYAGQVALNSDRPDDHFADYIFADSQDELSKAIRQNIHFGADWIKLVVDDQEYIYSEEDIRFAVEEAAKSGRRVAAHCMSERGAHNAAAAGVASIEHAVFVSDDTLRLMKENGVTLVGTELTRRSLTQLGAGTFYDAFIDRLVRAHRLGLPMAFGSDIFMHVEGHDRGWAAMSTIDSWQEAGIPPLDLIQAMTINAARLLGIDAKVGAVEPGMIADIIATKENPLENLQTLKNVIFVMKNGVVITRDRQTARLPNSR